MIFNESTTVLIIIKEKRIVKWEATKICYKQVTKQLIRWVIENGTRDVYFDIFVILHNTIDREEKEVDYPLNKCSLQPKKKIKTLTIKNKIKKSLRTKIHTDP